MKEWFENLQPRERLYVIGGGVFLLLFVLYMAVWAPLSNNLKSSRETVAQQRQDLEWMRAASEQVQKLGLNRSTNRGSRNRSLLAVVDQEIQAAQLKGPLQRMEPDGAQSVKIWINKGAFDSLIGMLGKLETEQGISVKSLSINPTDTQGLIDARITLTRGSG